MERNTLLDIYHAALKAADPYIAVKKAVSLKENKLTINKTEYDLSNFNRVIVIGAGKGTVLMARALEDVLGDRIDAGLIIVKYGHTRHLNKISQVEASHPLPDSAGVRGTAEILEMLEKADDKTLIICLLSGGGSSLLVSPAEGLTLKDKQIATELLLKAGASIDELNTVRKHLSKIKGGRLARIAYPATVITLILSDVIGDRLDVIASGPTAPDSTTFMDAVKVVEKYNLVENLPKRAIQLLKKGAADKMPDTPKANKDCFKKGSTVIVGSLGLALQAARNKAEEMGFETKIVTDKLQGEARYAALYLADATKETRKYRMDGKPLCLISGGETTVNVRGMGKGGRNQELALAFAMEIEGVEGITFLSAGTDGTDGPTDAAGAVVNSNTVELASRAGLDPQVYLADNDSYTFFERLDALTGSKHHIKTGPTGTNVMDIQLIVVSDSIACKSDVVLVNEIVRNE